MGVFKGSDLSVLMGVLVGNPWFGVGGSRPSVVFRVAKVCVDSPTLMLVGTPPLELVTSSTSTSVSSSADT